MPKSLAPFVWKCYGKVFEHRFRYHPKKEEILKRMEEGDFSAELIDLWFAEAEMYEWEKLIKRIPGGDSGPCGPSKTITFKMHRGEE